MQIFTTVNKLCDQYSNIAVALGTFDGIHIGHQAVIGKAVSLARSTGGTSVVFTFSNHPLSIIAPERCPSKIVTNEYKAELLEQLGVDILLNIPFTPELLKYSPEQFIDLLQTNLQPRHIIVGPNYSFGYKSLGNPDLLAKAGAQKNFAVEVQPAVYLDDLLVSSTLIRQYIAAGKVAESARLLGRPFKLQGKVISGNQRGRLLGFPTANLNLPEKFAIPDNGVYAVRTHYRSSIYPSIANIGTNPTFQDANRHIEVHLLEFTGDLYSQMIGVEFLHKIRPEQTFSNVKELIKQINLDIEAARQYY